ncbi:hypothetical protein T07_7498 [Trichinella nelsoni]|uniref:Uncharacterized protein n=1 Tax=Trichinella nelsoni TaxID=6336 RepID=A0A0V0RYR8_9BILA|nr:hypothetical protein T07_7498 [Trichinella nelsoni]
MGGVPMNVHRSVEHSLFSAILIFNSSDHSVPLWTDACAISLVPGTFVILVSALSCRIHPNYGQVILHQFMDAIHAYTTCPDVRVRGGSPSGCPAVARVLSRTWRLPVLRLCSRGRCCCTSAFHSTGVVYFLAGGKVSFGSFRCQVDGTAPSQPPIQVSNLGLCVGSQGCRSTPQNVSKLSGQQNEVLEQKHRCSHCMGELPSNFFWRSQ